PFRRILCSGEGYLVRRRDGRILAGSTIEEVGFDKSVTASGIAALLGAAVGMVPSLAAAPVLGTWSGLRPATADGLPAIGPGAAPPRAGCRRGPRRSRRACRGRPSPRRPPPTASRRRARRYRAARR